MRLDSSLQANQLLHQFFIDLQPACSIDDQHIAAFSFRLFYSRQSDLLRLPAFPHGEHRRIYCLSHYFQLVDSGRTIDIACAQHRFLAVFLKIIGQLAAGGCFTGTLQTDHHVYRKPLRGIGQFASGPAHQLGKLIVYDLDHLLTRGQTRHNFFAQRFLFHAVYEFLYDLEVYIRLQQSQLDFTHGCVDVCLRQASFSLQAFKDILQFFGQSFECHRLIPPVYL